MKYILFTTTTCPKCPAVKSFVAEKINFPGEILDNSVPGFAAQIQKFGVQNAPTILIFDDDEKELFRGNEVVEIAEFLNRQGASE